MIFLAWPNNPTGNLFVREDVRRVIEQAPGLVVLDEAYHAFAGDSFMDQLGKHDNLLVMRTLEPKQLEVVRIEPQLLSTAFDTGVTGDTVDMVGIGPSGMGRRDMQERQEARWLDVTFPELGHSRTTDMAVSSGGGAMISPVRGTVTAEAPVPPEKLTTSSPSVVSGRPSGRN